MQLFLYNASPFLKGITVGHCKAGQKVIVVESNSLAQAI